MAALESPLPVKYVVAALYKEVESFTTAREELCRLWGVFDFEGEDHHFDVTDYYKSEMGTPLYRRLLAFEILYDPMLIIAMKLKCNEIEVRMAVDGRRCINLDAGYLDHNKFLLASAKEAGQKVYLGKGIYADLSGRYKAGIYQPFEWTFPDFRDGRYATELLGIRKLYMHQIKQFRQKT